MYMYVCIYIYISEICPTVRWIMAMKILKMVGDILEAGRITSFPSFCKKKHSFFSWKQSPKKSSEPLAMLAMLALLVSTDWMANICRKVTKRYHSVCMDSMYQCCEPDDPELQHHH